MRQLARCPGTSPAPPVALPSRPKKSRACQGVGETTRAAVSVQDVSAKLAAVSERLSATVTEFIKKVGTGETRAAA